MFSYYPNFLGEQSKDGSYVNKVHWIVQMTVLLRWIAAWPGGAYMSREFIKTSKNPVFRGLMEHR